MILIVMEMSSIWHESQELLSEGLWNKPVRKDRNNELLYIYYFFFKLIKVGQQFFNS